MDKLKTENTLIKENISQLDIISEPKEREAIDRALYNMILDHPELIIEEKGRNERLQLHDCYVGKGGYMRFIENQIRAMVSMKCSEEKIMDFIDRQTNEHRPDLIQDDLRHLRELDNLRWNLFELDFDENCPSDLGASFSLSFAGVYAVYENNKIIYFGTAVNLRQRFIQHLFPHTNKFATPLYKYLSGDFKGIKIKAKKIDKKFKRLTLEGRIIHKIKPIVNTHYRKNES